MKKIRHHKLPITLESADHLTPDMLKAIQIQMAEYSWDDWIDEDGKWFKYWNKPNPKQMDCLMDYKEVMDLWDVWTIGGIIIYKYIKSIIDNWNE